MENRSFLNFYFLFFLMNIIKVFGQDQNALQIFWKTGEKALPLADKNKLAEVLVTEIVEHYHK